MKIQSAPQQEFEEVSLETMEIELTKERIKMN